MQFKQIKNIITASALIIFGMVGCGGDSKDPTSSTPQEVKIALSVGVEQEVLSGDSINPIDPTSEIEFRYVATTGKKFVTLISGSADIIR